MSAGKSSHTRSAEGEKNVKTTLSPGVRRHSTSMTARAWSDSPTDDACTQTTGRSTEAVALRPQDAEALYFFQHRVLATTDALR